MESHKGKKCPYRNIRCQEAYCMNCYIYQHEVRMREQEQQLERGNTLIARMNKILHEESSLMDQIEWWASEAYGRWLLFLATRRELKEAIERERG